MRLRCASLRSAVTAVRSRGLAATAWRSTARHRAGGHATDAPGHRANVAATVRGRLLSSVRAPLPDLASAIDSRTCEGLRDRGYAVVDGFLGETWCRPVWKSTSELGCHRADDVMGTMSRRWRGTSTLSSRRSYGDSIASMAWGARNLMSTQVPLATRRHHHARRAAIARAQRDASRAARHDVLTGQE